MKYLLIALLLLVACKPGKERIVDKSEALSVVKDELSPIGGLEVMDCPEVPTRTNFYVCYGVKMNKDVTVRQIDDALKERFDLPSPWVFEYGASAKYHDAQNSIIVGIVYTTLSKALGNDDLAPGYSKILEIYISDNPYK